MVTQWLQYVIFINQSIIWDPQIFHVQSEAGINFYSFFYTNACAVRDLMGGLDQAKCVKGFSQRSVNVSVGWDMPCLGVRKAQWAFGNKIPADIFNCDTLCVQKGMWTEAHLSLPNEQCWNYYETFPLYLEQ